MRSRRDRARLTGTAGQPLKGQVRSLIRKGDTVENPVTGERVTFLETATETNGERVLIDVTVEPDGFVAAAHVHPYQSERFEILEGTLEFKLGKEIVAAGPGDVVMVEPGTLHRFRNIGESSVRFITEVRPALGFEQFIETMFALAADGKTNRKGMPNPLQLAVIMSKHFDLVRLPFPPAFMQKAGLVLGAPLGRLVGYQPTYTREATALTATPVLESR
jgi:mannose-6-phosphate isomerase-like protein (cupin superfamily)